MLDEIRTFVAMAETGSLQRAAERLFLTPSAVTRRIHRLEGVLKTRLLDRRAKPGRISISSRLDSIQSSLEFSDRVVRSVSFHVTSGIALGGASLNSSPFMISDRRASSLSCNYFYDAWRHHPRTVIP
jgi:DNA-binding transcriptional LysR family regulator